MTELVILAILGQGLLHLALRTWVSGPRSLVAGGHGLCGRFRHRKRSQNVVGRTHGRTDAHIVCNYI